MLGAKKKTVRVTTREELDRALKSADRIEIEGDAALLRYAESRVEGAPDLAVAAAPKPPARVEVEYTRREWPTGIVGLAAPTPGVFRSAPVPGPSVPAHAAPPLAAPKRSPIGLWLLPATLILLLVGLAAYLVIASSPTPPAPDRAAEEPLARPQPAPLEPAPDRFEHRVPSAGGGTARPPTAVAPAPTTAGNQTDAMIVQLGWVFVALVAVIALFLLARFAVASGRNVEISWKVTEKVSGKLVIAKVQTRALRPARV